MIAETFLILFFAGPQYWNKEFQTCKGKHQSPINIEDHDVEDVRFPSLKFVGLQEPQETTLTNNGHTGNFFLNSR